nr:hypothetical protein [Mycobacterium sp. UM_NZ2]
MARCLARHVAVFDPKGNLRQFAPGDCPPAWAVKQITNPKAWGGPSESDGDEPVGRHRAAGGGGEGPPPLAGPNAGRDPWAKYARSLDVEVDEDDKRDVIVTKIRDAGHPVE